MNRTAIFVCSFALLLASCGHGRSANTESKENTRQASPESVEAIRKRASFEMNCAPESIEVTVIEAGNLMRPWTLGASGCSKRATYLYRAGMIINNGMAETPAAK